MNKKILTIVLLLAFLPAIIAAVWILNVTSSRFSATNVSSVSFSLNGETPVTYTSKEDRTFFCDLKDGFQSIEPQSFDENVHTLYKLDFLRIQGDVTYFLCLSADTKNCLAYDIYDRWYRIDKDKAEELLLKYNISDVYKYSFVPNLKILSEGLEHNYSPQTFNWNYLVANGGYTNNNSSNTANKNQELVISSVKKFELYFDVEPDWYGVKIYQDDTIVYDGLLESFADFNFNEDARLRAVITAEWYESTTNLYNGIATYEFEFDYDIPATFSLNKNDFSTGEVAYIYIANANDENFAISSELIDQEITSCAYGLGQLVLIPIPVSAKTGEYNVELKAEHSYFNIPIIVNEKNYDTVKVGLIRSENASSYNSALIDFKNTILELNNTVLDKCHWSNGLLTPLQKYVDGKEQYWVSAPSFGVYQTVDGTAINERSFGIHYVKSVEARELSVRAVADGKIVFAGLTEAYGNTVVIEHGYGFKSVYGHLDSINFSVDDEITVGSVIANTNPIKYSIAANEFFFGIYVNGEFVNPFNFIEEPRNPDASQTSPPIDFLQYKS